MRCDHPDDAVPLRSAGVCGLWRRRSAVLPGDISDRAIRRGGGRGRKPRRLGLLDAVANPASPKRPAAGERILGRSAARGRIPRQGWARARRREPRVSRYRARFDHGCRGSNGCRRRAAGAESRAPVTARVRPGLCGVRDAMAAGPARCSGRSGGAASSRRDRLAARCGGYLSTRSVSPFPTCHFPPRRSAPMRESRWGFRWSPSFSAIPRRPCSGWLSNPDPRLRAVRTGTSR